MVPLLLGVAATGLRATRHASPQRRGFRRTPPALMPEGPECLVHAESLHRRFAGRTLSRAAILSGRYAGNSSMPGRGAPPAGWAELRGSLPAVVGAVRAKGKFIWWELSPLSGALPELTLWSTLGMSGAWSTGRNTHSRVCLELAAEPAAVAPTLLFYNDQRNFGVLTVCTEHAALRAKLETLGPSWLDEGGGITRDGFMEIVRRQCSSRRRAAVPVAKFLMDQSKTAGIGNYVLSEVALPRGPSQHSTTAQPRCHSRWCCLAQLTDCVAGALQGSRLPVGGVCRPGRLGLGRGARGGLADAARELRVAGPPATSLAPPTRNAVHLTSSQAHAVTPSPRRPPLRLPPPATTPPPPAARLRRWSRGSSCSCTGRRRPRMGSPCASLKVRTADRCIGCLSGRSAAAQWLLGRR